jgi:ADP-ribose pyrophosphatase YjhB (NUDIX family)
MSLPRVAAGALIRNATGQVLLVRPSYKDGWDIPGGYVEPGESPGEACTRELHEEIGVGGRTGRLLVVDWAPHPAEGDKLLFVFDGSLMTEEEPAGLHLDGVEIVEARFHGAEELPQLMPARLARRLALAPSSALGRVSAVAGSTGVNGQ